MNKTILQRISEETGCDLTPTGVARDCKLRALYDAYIRARGTAREAATYKAFAEFVSAEYCNDSKKD